MVQGEDLANWVRLKCARVRPYIKRRQLLRTPVTLDPSLSTLLSANLEEIRLKQQWRIVGFLFADARILFVGSA
jgi:hypothetical protein